MFTLLGTTVTWNSIQQLVVALLTTQADCITRVERVKEVIWLKGMTMGDSQGCMKIHCDSHGHSFGKSPDVP
jgi:phosphoribosyl-AMP cyclohydrolase